MTAEEIRRMKERVAQVRAEMERACRAAGRAPGEVLLCAASKTQNSETVRAAAALDIDLFGENRVQELCEKYAAGAYSGKPVHFIGHLQTNKVRQVVGHVSLIQSVDSLRLLQALEREAARQGVVQGVLLEVNIGAEESKSGFRPDEILAVAEKFVDFPHLEARGLMAIPPVSHVPGENLKFFSEMRHLFVDISRKKYDNVTMAVLSMGMSDDFADAIACGSTMIRVGTAIFGPRSYHQV